VKSMYFGMYSRIKIKVRRWRITEVLTNWHSRNFEIEKRFRYVSGTVRLKTKCVTSSPLLACALDGHTLLWKLVNQQSAPFLNVRFVKKLPVTHVRQVTIFAGQTVKFYRSVTGDRHLFRPAY
jgi:hypothetical protein